MRCVLAALAVMTVASCESFRGDTPGASGSDAGSDAAPNAASDAANRVPPAPADAGFSCAGSSATSCLDFGAGYPGWFAYTEDGALPVRIVDGALFAEVHTTTVSGASRIHRTVVPTPKSRLSFDVKVDPVVFTGDTQFSLAELLCTDNQAQYDGPILNVRSSLAVGLSDPHKPPFGAGVEPLSIGVWHRFVIEVDWSATPTALASLTMDERFVHTIAVADCRPKKDFTVRLGLGTATRQGATASYDNVVYEELP